MQPTQLTQSSDIQQQYGTAKSWRLLIYFLIPPFALLFIALPFVFWQDSQPLGLMLGMTFVSFGMTAFFLYGLVETIKARHIITADKLIYQGAFRRKELPLRNLKGYRTDQQYARFYSSDPADPKIRIGYTSENYAEIQQWFAERYPDLDVLEQEQAAASLLQNEELGQTTDEREATIGKARRTAQMLNIAGGGVAAWLLLAPQPYRWAVAAGLAVPVLAALALWLHPRALRLDERKNSAYPSATIAILGPSTALLLRALFDFEILDYTQLWPQAGIIALFFALALLSGSRHFLRQTKARLGVLLSAIGYAALYGFAAICIYNCAFDENGGIVYEAQVLDKHISSGKTRTYYLNVSAWGPRTAPEDVTVSQQYYQQTSTGDTVRIYQLPGRLHVPWFTVAE